MDLTLHYPIFSYLYHKVIQSFDSARQRAYAAKVKWKSHIEKTNIERTIKSITSTAYNLAAVLVEEPFSSLHHITKNKDCKEDDIEQATIHQYKHFPFDQVLKKLAEGKVPAVILDDVIKTNQDAFNQRALFSIMQIYIGNLSHFMDLPHLCHDLVRQQPATYQNIPFQAIFPNAAFKSLIKVFYQTKVLIAAEQSVIIPLLAKLFVTEDNDFKGWHIALKTKGCCAGFILSSPTDGKKAYVKDVEKPLHIAFYTKVLSHLGIKAPETELIKMGEQILLLTWDMSRRYTKTTELKMKLFSTLHESGYRYGSGSGFNFTSFSASPGMRVSYAKLMIACLVLQIRDLNDDNLGVLLTRKNNLFYEKFSIVDFDLYTDIDLSGVTHFDLLRKAFPYGATCGFVERLTDDDLRQACLELMHPKQYDYASPSLLLFQNGSPKITTDQAIERAYEDMRRGATSAGIRYNENELATMTLQLKADFSRFFGRLAAALRPTAEAKTENKTLSVMQ